MKLLTICHPKYGHKMVELPADIDTEFEKIMQEGYGNKVPAIFYRSNKKGGYDQVDKADVKGLISDDVDEVLVVGPLQGG